MKIVVGGRMDYMRFAWQNEIDTKKIMYFEYNVLRKLSLKNKLLNRIASFLGKFNKTIAENNKYKNVLREYFDIDSLKRKDKILFIIYEMNFLSTDLELLNFLRSYYKKSRFVLFFSNKIGSVREKTTNYLLNIRDFYDLIYTFNRKDAEKYGFLLFFHGAFPYDKPEEEHNENCDSKVLWIGKNKNRYQDLVQIGKALISKGLKPKFIITDCPENKTEFGFIIMRNGRLSYENVVNYINNTQFLLEFCMDDNPTIRFTEAIAHKKRLITNCKALKEDLPEAFKNGQFIDINEICDSINLEDSFIPINPVNVSVTTFIDEVTSKLDFNI